MAERSSLIQAFLARSGWTHAARHPLAGDASARRYERLIQTDSSRAVLMDADPAQGQSVADFQRIAEWLRAAGLSAPVILDTDREAGFMLLEDFGDDLFTRLAAADPSLEMGLYSAAVDVLLSFRGKVPPADLAVFSPQMMAAMIDLAFDWYARPLGSDTNEAQRIRIQAALETVLHTCGDAAPVFCLRDFHSENMIWLPDRNAVRRVGLLDFQDAVIAHPAYDLVSLVQDARRDVAEDVAEAALHRYAVASGIAPDTLRRACHAQGVQRHLRILGIFGRLSLRDGKPGYVDLMPRVWGHLQTCLATPGMEHLSDLLAEALPAPDEARLETLRAHAA